MARTNITPEQREQAIVDLFWDWYESIHYELWTHDQRAEHTSDAMQRAMVLGIQFKVDTHETRHRTVTKIERV